MRNVSQHRRFCCETLEPRTLLSTTAYADPIAYTQILPDDPMYTGSSPSQWGMSRINASSAWDITTGSSKVVVASVDSGVDYNHPDLALNIWINQAEVPNAIWKHIMAYPDWDIDRDGRLGFRDLNATDVDGNLIFWQYDLDKDNRITGRDLLGDPYLRTDWENGLDSGGDRNAFADDLIGWDYYDADNDPMDEDNHGTHTAGVIGAMGNNIEGVAGLAWRVQIMPLRFLGPNGTGDVGDAARAIIYAADSGARLSNNSWGIPEGRTGDMVYNAIKYAANKNHLVIASAGNDGLNTDYAYNRNYPANYNLGNIISVTAVNISDAKPSWANFGAKSVDLAAPGVNIISTVLGGYALASGTSMAAPHVTGVAALMLARNPNLSYAQLKSLILNNVDYLKSLTGKTLTGGRLNAYKALAAASPKPQRQTLFSTQRVLY